MNGLALLAATDLGLVIVDLASCLIGRDCTGDVTADGVVDGADLRALLAAWGACPDCDADLDRDGDVDAADLAVLLGAWGDCP